MIKQEQLNQIKQMLDIIASLDDSYWVDKSWLNQLYSILTNIENEETFTETYRAILGNLNTIIEKIERFDKEIARKFTDKHVKVKIVEKIPIKVDLSAMSK